MGCLDNGDDAGGDKHRGYGHPKKPRKGCVPVAEAMVSRDTCCLSELIRREFCPIKGRVAV